MKTFTNLFFFLAFMYLFFSCKENKIENKVIDNQIDTSKAVIKKDTTPIMYYRDSLFYSLQKQKNLKDDAFLELGISSVVRFNFGNDKLLFIHLDNDCYGKTNLKQDLYICHWNKAKWQVIDSLDLDYDAHWIDTIQAIDVNFDGQKEILVKYNSVSGSRSMYPYEFFNYDSKTHTIKHCQSFISSLDKIVNTKNKTIILGDDAGIYHQQRSIYRWQADTLQTIREIILTRDYDSNKFTVKIYELEKDKSKKTIEKVFYNNDKAWSYFEKWQ